MATEAALWKLMRASKLPGHWVRVENRVEKGTPDVEYSFTSHRNVSGWIELKSADRWPVDPEVALKIPHWTKHQRFWHRRRAVSGGVSWVLLRVDRPEKLYLLISGLVASEILGRATKWELIEAAHAVWGPKWDRELFLGTLAANGLDPLPF